MLRLGGGSGRGMHPHTKTVLLSCLSLVALAHALTQDEAFAAADRDSNGSLSREEFGLLASRVYGILGDPNGASGGGGAPDASGSGGWWGLSAGPGFLGGFISGVGMIIATEVGDKTFFIAAIMAMQHPRALVFAGAISALAIMTVLSAALGFALPNILPREYTHYAGALLFLYFGVKMLKEGFEAEEGHPSDELAEVEQELMAVRRADDADDDIEGRPKAPSAVGAASPPTNGHGRHAAIAAPKDAYGVFVQALTLTFLAEWGDRSQIATIAMAAAKDVVGVTVGGILGHSLCTGVAVLGGRLLAARISERTVHLVGGGLFLVFGLHSLIFGL